MPTVMSIIMDTMMSIMIIMRGLLPNLLLDVPSVKVAMIPM